MTKLMMMLRNWNSSEFSPTLKCLIKIGPLLWKVLVFWTVTTVRSTSPGCGSTILNLTPYGLRDGSKGNLDTSKSSSTTVETLQVRTNSTLKLILAMVWLICGLKKLNNQLSLLVLERSLQWPLIKIGAKFKALFLKTLRMQRKNIKRRMEKDKPACSSMKICKCSKCMESRKV